MSEPTIELKAMREALKPCPFCGSEAKQRISFGTHYIECSGCGAEMGTRDIEWDVQETKSITAWNTRPASEVVIVQKYQLVELHEELYGKCGSFSHEYAREILKKIDFIIADWLNTNATNSTMPCGALKLLHIGPTDGNSTYRMIDGSQQTFDHAGNFLFKAPQTFISTEKPL